MRSVNHDVTLRTFVPGLPVRQRGSDLRQLTSRWRHDAPQVSVASSGPQPAQPASTI
jgi:hypothetical protein